MCDRTCMRTRHSGLLITTPTQSIFLGALFACLSSGFATATVAPENMRKVYMNRTENRQPFDH